jgi:hypothetical protein
MKRMRMAWIAALACTLGCGNGSNSTAGSAQGQSHWLERCEGETDCGGLSCICGVCIAACSASGGCAVEGRTTACQSPETAGARALCGAAAPEPICLEECGAGCASDQRCAGGVCVPAGPIDPRGDDAGGAGRPADAGAGGRDGSVEPGTDAGVDSGMSDAAVAPGQDAGVSPLDCNAFPAFDRSCDDASDCVVGARQISCCGGALMTGLNAAALSSFQDAASICATQFPACGCAAWANIADDGSTADIAGTAQAGVECIAGMCQSTFLLGPTACGPNLNCDGATEICVAREPVGPSIQWSCRPVPAGCERDRTCACAASTLCDATFVQCTDVPGPNAIDCNCPTCQ